MISLPTTRDRYVHYITSCCAWWLATVRRSHRIRMSTHGIQIDSRVQLDLYPWRYLSPTICGISGGESESRRTLQNEGCSTGASVSRGSGDALQEGVHGKRANYLGALIETKQLHHKIYSVDLTSKSTRSPIPKNEQSRSSKRKRRSNINSIMILYNWIEAI